MKTQVQRSHATQVSGPDVDETLTGSHRLLRETPEDESEIFAAWVASVKENERMKPTEKP